MAPKSVNLPEVVASPEAFRNALVVDTDAGPRRLGEILDDFQRADFAALDDAWKRIARRGKWNPQSPKLGYLERHRGAAKSADIACMVAYGLLAAPHTISGVCAAADKDQARLTRDAILKLTKLNPWLAKFLDPQAYKIVNVKTGSSLEIISADAASSYGLTPDFLILEEVTHWGESQELFDSLFSAWAKRANCLLLIVANSGFGQGESWQWDVRENARTDPAWYFHRPDKMASWITEAKLQQQRKILKPIVYRRLWENEWTIGLGDAIDEAEIERAFSRIERAPTPDEMQPAAYYAGLDVAIKKDNTGLTIVGVKSGTDRAQLAHSKVWRPTNGKKVDLDVVEEHIIEQYKLRPFRLYYDFSQAAQLVGRLMKVGIECEEVRQQGADRVGMTNAMLETFENDAIDLYDDGESNLRRELRHLRISEGRSGIKIIAPRLKDAGHCDLATSLSIALFGVRKYHLLGPGSNRPQIYVPPSGDELKEMLKKHNERFAAIMKKLPKIENDEPERGWHRLTFRGSLR